MLLTTGGWVPSLVRYRPGITGWHPGLAEFSVPLREIFIVFGDFATCGLCPINVAELLFCVNVMTVVC